MSDLPEKNYISLSILIHKNNTCIDIEIDIFPEALSDVKFDKIMILNRPRVCIVRKKNSEIFL